MTIKSEKELLERDAQRDIGTEILASVRQMKARKAGRTHKVSSPGVASIRMKVGMSQDGFAQLLGVSIRTLQDWEQGRRHPSGSARTLLRVADEHPEVLREIAA